MRKNKLIKKLLTLLFPYKKQILIIFSCLIICSVVNIFLPLLSKEIIDKGLYEKNINILLLFCSASIVLYLIIGFLDVFKEKQRIKMAYHLKFDLNSIMFDHLQNLKINYLKNYNNSNLIDCVNIDIDNISQISDENSIFVITQLFGFVGSLIGLFIISYKLAFIVIIFIPLNFFITYYFSKKNMKVTYNWIKQRQNYTTWFSEIISGIFEIKLFNIGENKKQEFDKLKRNEIKELNSRSIVSKYKQVTTTFLVQFLIIFIYLCGGLMLYSDNITVGSIVAFITYVSYLTNSVSSVMGITFIFSGIIPSAQRFFEFMHKEEEDYSGMKLPKNYVGNLEFRNVTYDYGDNKNVIENISLKIPYKSKVAFVGKNGAGKSTLINLLLKVDKVKSGIITIDNIDINKISLKEYRSLFCVISQTPYLFNESILNNICLYDKIDMEKLNDIIDICGLRDLVNQYSLNYKIGENGKFLSGGQKQKIALARAMIHNKHIFIFDEATANVDVESEDIINSSLLDRFSEQTIITITHNPENLKKVDKIFFIDNGAIAGEGSYEYLVNNCEDFRKSMVFKNELQN